MKNLMILIFIAIGSIAIAQQNMQDVVYLKNGSIIRGIIIEQVPNQSLKVETSDKSIFIYQMEDVQKIVKENIEKKEKNNDLDIDERKGYLGLSLGMSTSLITGSLNSMFENPSPSYYISFNFGYLFSKNIGIAASYLTAANEFNKNIEDNAQYSEFNALIAGPLFSFDLKRNTKLELSPMIGYAKTTLANHVTKYYIIQGESSSNFAYNIAATLRYDISKKTSLFFTLGLFGTDAKFDAAWRSNYSDDNIEQNFSSLALSAGFAYRLK
jgi:hypothetical protein